LDRAIWGVLALALALVIGAFVANQAGFRARPRPAPLPVLSEVRDFQLTNQFGQPVVAADLAGRVWLADIVFTRCPGPCVRLTQQLRQLQVELPPDAPVGFLTLTADPAYDTPAVLRGYSERFQADSSRWQFLTGQKSELYRLAIQDLLLAVSENSDPDRAALEDLFIHSTKVILIDRAGRVRGAFDGEDPGARPAIRAAVEAVVRER